MALLSIDAVTTVLEPPANVPLTADKFNQVAVALAVQFSEMLHHKDVVSQLTVFREVAGDDDEVHTLTDDALDRRIENRLTFPQQFGILVEVIFKGPAGNAKVPVIEVRIRDDRESHGWRGRRGPL